MKKISEGNKGIQALAKKNPSLVEDKFGYDVPGYMNGGMPMYYQDGGIAGYMNGNFVSTGSNPYPTAYGPQEKPGIDEAVDEGQIDLEEFDNKIFNLSNDSNNPYNNTDLEPVMGVDPETGATVLTGYKDSSGNDVSIEDGMEIEEKASNRDLIRTGLSNFTNMMPDTPQTQQGRLVKSSLGTGAAKVNFKDGGYAGQGIQGFFMGGMAGEVGEDYE